MQTLFIFQILDADAESPTFSCVADSLEAAENRARAAGYREFLLVETVPNRFEEDVGKAQLDLLINPLLGPSWTPLIDALGDSFQNLNVGDFWTLSWLVGSSGDGPFVQALHESDGSLLVEIGPTELLDSLIDDKEQAMTFLGWDLPGHNQKLPNYLRFFEPGWNLWGVGAFAIQSLVLLNAIDESMLIELTTSAESEFDPNGRLVKVPLKAGEVDVGVAYRLPNPSPRGTNPRKSKKTAKSDRAKPSRGKQFLPVFAYEESGLGSAFSFNTVWPPPDNRSSLGREDVLQLRLNENLGPLYSDDDFFVPEWGDDFPWVWGPVSAFRSLADPGAPLPFPKRTTPGIADHSSALAPAYWSTLRALCFFRLGWARPAWGIAEWLASKTKLRDPTLEFIRQHWTLANLRVFAAWSESLGRYQGGPPWGTDEWCEPSRFLKGFLKSHGHYEGKEFECERETVLNSGGWDSLHLTRHVSSTWYTNSFTHRVREAMPLREMGPNRDLMVLESAQSWFDWLFNWKTFGISEPGIGWVGNPGEPVCDVYVKPIGFMGSYRIGVHTGIPYATTEEIHHLGNPRGDGELHGPAPARWDQV